MHARSLIPNSLVPVAPDALLCTVFALIAKSFMVYFPETVGMLSFFQAAAVPDPAGAATAT